MNNNANQKQSDESGTEMKWWGWGSPCIRADFSTRPSAIPYLKKHFNFAKDRIEDTFSAEKTLEKLVLPPTCLTSGLVEGLKKIVEKHNFSSTNYTRLINSFGKSYRDLITVRTNQISDLADAVVYPKNEEQIVELMKFCKKEKIAIIPFGGGSSVVGGLDVIRGKQKYLIVVNLKKLNKVISVNSENHTAIVECGIFGPHLEKELNKHQYTLGHFPQSFEFSTLGGWIAARSSGQNSVGFGGIEDIVVSLKIVTPEGVVQTLRVPRGATGPSLKEIIVGSEGILGIITSAEVVIKPKATLQDYCMYVTKDFELGKEIGREMIQQKINVALIRISDEDETEGMFSLASDHSGKFGAFIKNKMKKFLKYHFKFNNIDPDRFCSFLIGIEAHSELELYETKIKINYFLRKHKSVVSLGNSPGKRWLKDRFYLPYLRDELMTNGFFVETLETATSWDNVSLLHKKIKDGLSQAGEGMKTPTKVYAHISHLYESGASLYFTIVAIQSTADPIAQWSNYKETANNIIYNNGGVISHHHGIGFDHRKHLFHSPLESSLIKCIKNNFDPDQIMNPGKIIDITKDT